MRHTNIQRKRERTVIPTSRCESVDEKKKKKKKIAVKFNRNYTTKANLV